MADLPNLLIATRNAHKTEEIAAMLSSRYAVRDLTQIEGLPNVEETGTTFLENATLKAVQISECVDGIVLSDDSGIEVDALEGRPGVYSSSFGGVEGDNERNNAKLFEEIENVPQDQRSARFRCVMVLAKNGERLAYFDGAVEGRVIDELRGDRGFGYDPLFIPEGYEKTFAELGEEIKNTFSHRGRALEKVVKWLEDSKEC